MPAITSRGADRAQTLLVGYDEAARRIGVSNRTLRGLVYGGELRAVSIGHRRLIAIADLEDFVEKLREQARH
jgi:excisionase family DNA binding protein